MVESTLSKNAAKCVKQAEYALKTGVFKWSKDYDEAASKYEQAAKLYKENQSDEQAAMAYTEAAKCYEQMKQFLLAGDAYSEAARLLPDRKWEQSLQLLK